MTCPDCNGTGMIQKKLEHEWTNHTLSFVRCDACECTGYITPYHKSKHLGLVNKGKNK